jgi:hypothetical protein
MDRSTLRKLQHHAKSAADIIVNSVVNSAADTLADPEADPRDSLAALADAQVLYGVAAAARAGLKEVV